MHGDKCLIYSRASGSRKLRELSDQVHYIQDQREHFWRDLQSQYIGENMKKKKFLSRCYILKITVVL